MGANLTEHSTILIFPADFIILLCSFTMVSVLIPAGDGALLENGSLPGAIKNIAVGWGSLGTGSLLGEKQSLLSKELLG